MKHSWRLLLVLFAGLGWGPQSSGHDLWIEPSTFVPAVGQPLSIRLRVGQAFRGDLLPRMPELIDRFVLVHSLQSLPVEGMDRSDPAGLVRIATSGVHIIGYQSLPSRIDVQPATFERYLIEEGLDEVLIFRQHEGSNGTVGRERFSRCAKAYLRAGSGTTAPDLPRLDFTLEILPEWERFPPPSGHPLRVQLRFRGVPLSGALIKAFSKRHPDRVQGARTDRDGRAGFVLDDGGVWLIKSVHMIDSGGDADWESFWASLTFKVAE